jgi:hypothetical protein
MRPILADVYDLPVLVNLNSIERNSPGPVPGDLKRATAFQGHPGGG